MTTLELLSDPEVLKFLGAWYMMWAGVVAIGGVLLLIGCLIEMWLFK